MGSINSLVAKIKNEEQEVLILCLAEEPCAWRLEPVLPRAISSKKIKTFAAGTGLAVATTVAMPFVCAGVVGLIGAEAGLLVNAVAATLAGAEALASVGVVGATAAICFRQDPRSLMAKLEDDADEDEAHEEEASSSAKCRPFCDWRSW